MALFEIGVGEILSTLSKTERLEAYAELSSEFDSSDGPRLDEKRLTPTEEDFRQILCDLWERRIYLTPEQINRIADTLTAPVVQ